MKVIALGRTKWLYDSIVKLKKGGHQIVLILTSDESPGYRVGTRDFESLAKEVGAAFLKTEKINRRKVVELIKKHDPDVGISVNWKTIISEEVINCFPKGILNAHAGDLPKYRGNAAPNWAIIRGEDKVALTLHLMVSELDAGAIALQREFPLSDNTYISDVYEFIDRSCPEMFLEVLDALEKGSLKLREQPIDPSLSLRCYPRFPRDGEIDWSLPAVEIARLIRAVSVPMPGAFTFLGKDQMVVWKAHATEPSGPFVGMPGQVAERKSDTGEIAVVTGNGFLVLEEVETEAGGRQKAADVIRSLRTRLGMDLAGEIKRLVNEIEKLKQSLNSRDRSE